jgi:hypothetical protein
MPSTPFTPRPLLGVHVGFIEVPDYSVGGIITGLNVAINGALTLSADSVTFLAAPPNLFNTGRRVSVTDSPGTQEINAMNTKQRNPVIIDDGLSADIQMYAVNNGGDPRPLISLVQLYDYFYAEWTDGTVAGSIFLNQFYGLRAELDMPLEGRGEQMVTLHLNEFDPGAPTIPQYYRYQIG